jgi:hypothetical protein
VVTYICHPSYTGSINRRIEVQVSLGETRDPIRKIMKAKRSGSVAQVVEHLLSKCKALNSNTVKMLTSFYTEHYKIERYTMFID